MTLLKKTAIFAALALAWPLAYADSFIYRIPSLGVRALTVAPPEAPGAGDANEELGLTVSPSEWDFGQVEASRRSSKTFSIKNSGAKQISLELEEPSAPFHLTSTTCGSVLASNAQCDITVEYLAGASAGRTSGGMSVASDKARAEISLEGESVSTDAAVVRIGEFPGMTSLNFTTGNLFRDGDNLIGHTYGGLQRTNLSTGASTSIALTGNFRSFGFPVGNADLRQTFPHPSNPSLVVVVGDYSYSGYPNASFVALLDYTGKLVSATYVVTNGASTTSTMVGSTLYVQAHGAQQGAMICSVETTPVSCQTSQAGGFSPAVDPSGVLHVRHWDRYGPENKQIVVLDPKATPTYVRKPVSGLPGGIESLAFGRDGNLYAAVSNSSAIWSIDRTTWTASVFAGSATESGDAGGTVKTARFGTKLQIQKSENGILVKDYTTHRLFEIQL